MCGQSNNHTVGAGGTLDFLSLRKTNCYLQSRERVSRQRAKKVKRQLSRSWVWLLLFGVHFSFAPWRMEPTSINQLFSTQPCLEVGFHITSKDHTCSRTLAKLSAKYRAELERRSWQQEVENVGSNKDPVENTSVCMKWPSASRGQVQPKWQAETMSLLQLAIKVQNKELSNCVKRAYVLGVCH